jgi:general secretion pathway protein H
MNRNRGFTLLELLMVLAIVSLMIAVVPPLLSGLGGGAELRGTTRQLAAAMRIARSEAILRRQEAVLTLDLEERFFQVAGDTRKVSLPESIKVKLYTAQTELLDGATGTIRFFPDGTSTGGHVALANEKIGYSVNVDWLTGRVWILALENPEGA